jgi:hypothetical protein
MRGLRLLALVLALALLAAGCGGGKKDSSSEGDQTIDTSDAPQVIGPQVGTTTTTPGAAAEAGPGRRTPAPWSAPKTGVAALIRRAGIEAFDAERLEFHIHAHLDVFVDGEPEPVAAEIGIDRVEGVIAPLHTHDETGIIHVENDKQATFTLGELFNEWDVRLGATCVGSYCTPAKRVEFYVDGKPYSGDPREIQLTRHREIAVVIGAAPDEIPSTYDWPPNT